MIQYSLNQNVHCITQRFRFMSLLKCFTNAQKLLRLVMQYRNIIVDRNYIFAYKILPVNFLRLLSCFKRFYIKISLCIISVGSVYSVNSCDILLRICKTILVNLTDSSNGNVTSLTESLTLLHGRVVVLSFVSLLQCYTKAEKLSRFVMLYSNKIGDRIYIYL